MTPQTGVFPWATLPQSPVCETVEKSLESSTNCPWSLLGHGAHAATSLSRSPPACSALPSRLLSLLPCRTLSIEEISICSCDPPANWPCDPGKLLSLGLRGISGWTRAHFSYLRNILKTLMPASPPLESVIFPRSLLLETSRNQTLGTILGIIPSRPSQQTEQGNVCVYTSWVYTHNDKCFYV